MNSAQQDLQELIEETGPNITSVDVTIGKKTKTLYFRKIPYFRAQQIVNGPMRFNPPSKDGEGNDIPAVISIDPEKVGARNVQLIFESLVTAEGKPYLDRKAIEALPPELGKKLYEAAQKANALSDNAVADAEKNSDATDAADTSSSSPTGEGEPSQS